MLWLSVPRGEGWWYARQDRGETWEHEEDLGWEHRFPGCLIFICGVTIHVYRLLLVTTTATFCPLQLNVSIPEILTKDTLNDTSRWTPHNYERSIHITLCRTLTFNSSADIRPYNITTINFNFCFPPPRWRQVTIHVENL